MTKPTNVAEQIASLAFVEPGGEQVDLADDPAVIHALHGERILGQTVRAVESGLATGSAEMLNALNVAHEDAMNSSMRIEIMGLRVAQTLADAGVDYRILKGVALAHTLYNEPSLRSFRDVDVLVSGPDIDKAVAELSRLGATRVFPQLRDGFDARFGKSVTLRLDNVEIDLHRVLSPGPFGVWSRPSELFLLRRSYTVAGRELLTLDPTDHLIQACYHVALGQVTPVLANLLDVALLATGESDPVDFERFTETVERWRGAAVIKRAVRLVESRIDVELPEQLALYRHRSVPRQELDFIEPYLTEDPAGRFAALAPATLKALPMADRPAFAMAVGLPDGADPKDRVRDLLGRAKQLRST